MYYVYMMANAHNTVLYIGVTNDLVRRVYEHKSHAVADFTSRYHVEKLVYFRAVEDVESAIAYEKKLKGWSRQKKNDLIALKNPEWRELYDELL